MSLAIITLVFVGTVNCHIQMGKRAEWSGYSIAAEAMAVQQLEQIRAAIWDTQRIPMVDQTTNFPARTALALDLPVMGTNTVYATNYTTVTTWTLSSNPPTYLKAITVRTVWPLGGHYWTNSVTTYRSPD